MSVKLLYFAWVREKAGLSEETVDLPESAKTIADVIAWLKMRGGNYAEAFERDTVIRAAINQKHAKHDTPVTGAREIAFFPPVTGG